MYVVVKNISFYYLFCYKNYISNQLYFAIKTVTLIIYFAVKSISLIVYFAVIIISLAINILL